MMRLQVTMAPNTAVIADVVIAGVVVPAFHVLLFSLRQKDVDAPDKPWA
jgi:hypothetical protein